MVSGVAGLMLVVMGCDGEPVSRGGAEPSGTDPSQVDTAGVVSPLAVAWETTAGGTVLRADQTMTGKVTNLTTGVVLGDLSFVSSGLDGQLRDRVVGQFTLGAKETQTFSFPIALLPIQSEDSDSFVALQATLHTPDTRIVRIPSAPLYYHFRGDYAEAVFRTAEEMATDPAGGVFTTDPMLVRGRMMNDAGTMMPVIGGTSGATTLPTARQGLSGAHMVLASEDTMSTTRSALVVTPVTSALNATVNLCSTWRVQYIDSGFGEDVFPTSAWQDVPAKYARLVIVSTPQNALFWQGNLDVNGCATITALPAGNYQIQQSTTDAARGSVFIDSFFMSNGVEQTFHLFANFSVPASGTVNINTHPTFNNDAVQAAAVMGQVLATHNFNGGMGIPNGRYKIHTNEGCGAPIVPPTDSCFSGDVLHVGTTPVLGAVDSHWKFVIGHEMGHYVQSRAMGSISFNYNDVAAQASCKCDHYGPEWSNSLHCIQSREIIGASENEGFGHAFSSRTFNFTQTAEGIFVYYKPFLNDSGSVTFPPFGVNAFGPQKWMNNHCSAAGRGVEWDWLTFYYNVASSSSANNTPFSNLFSIYNRACSGSNTTKCTGQTVGWSTLLTGAQGFYGSTTNAAYVRFRDTGTAHGVNH